MEKIIAKKKYGQNFLKDENVLRTIASQFSVTEKDVIIEIGPGKGALTKYLSLLSAYFICYEIDERMKSVLDSFGNEKTKIIYTDFLQHDFVSDLPKSYEHLYVISNLPYYITTPILEKLMLSSVDIDGMTLLVQKEVAFRFSALPNSKDYGYFTVFLNHFFDVSIVCDVLPTSFVPAPKVMSSVIVLKRKKEIQKLDILSFQAFLKQAFHLKRKTLRNNLGNEILPFLEEHGLSVSIRAEELSYENFVDLYFYLHHD